MKDLRDQVDGVRGSDVLSCGFHMFEFQSSNKNALRSSCGMVCAFFATAYKERRSPIRPPGANKFPDPCRESHAPRAMGSGGACVLRA
jgi:hypothetical protein